MKRFLLILVTGLGVVTASAPAQAQVGVTTDLITGVVLGSGGLPMVNVLIEATSLESEISRSVQTDSRGRYTILFPDGGGQYRMVARAIGFMPIQVTLMRQADEDRLVWDVTMHEPSFTLDPITVDATLRRVQVPDRPTPGSTSQNLTPDQIATMPIDPTDLNILATLVPGVVGLDATDSTAAAISVAGQRPDANAITLDGASFGSGEIPQDGLRNTRVVTSTYDVGRGGFSGGLIASTTRSGTNRVQSSFNYNLRTDALAFGGTSQSPFTAGTNQHQLSGGVGGPILRNRLFAYVSAQTRLRSDPLRSLTGASPQDLQRLGVAQDSVVRFAGIANALGATTSQQFGSDRSNDMLSALLRMDYLVNNSHTLAVRGDWRGTEQEPTNVSNTALPETGGDNLSSGYGVMGTLSSRLGQTLIHEARVYVSVNRRSSEPYLVAPQGRVQVGSDLTDGSSGITILTLGGNSRMPTESNGRSIQLANELSWLPGNATHRIRVGGQITLERSTDISANNQLGTFTFNSLADFEAGNPASFTRTLAPAERLSQGMEWSAFVGDVWRASQRVQITYGLRLEGSRFTGAPAYNSALDAAFGVRTDRLPSEIDVSPRMGFSWTLGTSGFGTAPIAVVRGGFGRFRSPMSLGLISQAQTSTGLFDSELLLNCTGASVPIPDWRAYLADPTTIPTSCVGASTPISRGAPNATVFADDFESPKTWRGSLGVERRLTQLLRLNLEASYARGIGQYGFRDINLNDTPRFQLASEGSRPVFVDAMTVDAATGAIPLSASRIDPAFASVLEIGSDLQSETKQLTASLSGVTRGGIVLRLSYTFQDVRDQSSQSTRGGPGRLGGGGGNDTGGNPNEFEWARSSFERRHQFLTTVSYPFGTTLEVTAIGRLTSGTPYTPMVAQDINGDGARNDRAFVFDPGSTPTTTTELAMQRLMDSDAGNCLLGQVGTVVGRNSCTGPWQPSLDLQMNYRPSFLMNGNVSISMSTQNLLRGLDVLFHGEDGAKGWGLQARPDPTLLFVEGFDPVLQAYQYSVNERFGATGSGTQAQRNPFQITLQVRAFFGPDRGREALDRLRGGGGGGGGGRGGGFAGGGFGGGGRALGGGRGPGGPGGAGAITSEDFLGRFRNLLQDPLAIVLAMQDSLKLTSDQVASIGVLQDSLIAVNDSLAAQLQDRIEAAGAEQSGQNLLQVIRPAMAEAQGNLRKSIEGLRAIVSNEQWEMLPNAIRQAGQQGAGRRGGREEAEER